MSRIHNNKYKHLPDKNTSYWAVQYPSPSKDDVDFSENRSMLKNIAYRIIKLQ